MSIYPHLKILIVFSCVFFLTEDILQNRTTAAQVDLRITNYTEGAEFLRRIIHGEKMPNRPGVVMFTAPYRLCEGGCNGTDKKNFVLEFPVHIGIKARESYKKIYPKDYERVALANPNAPFKKKTTRAPTTECMKINVHLNFGEEVTELATTTETTTTSPETTTTPITTTTPETTTTPITTTTPETTTIPTTTTTPETTTTQETTTTSETTTIAAPEPITTFETTTELVTTTRTTVFCPQCPECPTFYPGDCIRRSRKFKTTRMKSTNVEAEEIVNMVAEEPNPYFNVAIDNNKLAHRYRARPKKAAYRNTHRKRKTRKYSYHVYNYHTYAQYRN